MKFFTFLSVMLFASAVLVNAQIPNASFENWTKGAPDGWWINNKPMFHFAPVSKTTNAHSGKYSVKGTVEPMGKGMPFAPVIHTSNVENSKFKISKKYKYMTGFYKLNSVKGDQFVAAVTMYKNGKDIGGGIKYFESAEKYTQFIVKIDYKTNDTPDECEIMFTIYPGYGGPDQMQVHKGTGILVDELSLK